MKRVYMDNAATTALSPEVLSAMTPAMTEIYGNASSVHAYGREARKLVEKARAQVAAALHAKPSEVYFTGSGTEADNWALRMALASKRAKGKHIVTTAIEHHAVLHTCEWLEKQGASVTYVPVDEDGIVSVAGIENAMRPDTCLVSVMAANNEIGTLQPIARIGALCREKGVWFHTDAVQAIGAIPIDVQAMNIDLLALSAHKFHGPKGVGALYMRTGLSFDPLIMGGAQERGKRAGTENVAGIVGLGAAIEIATRDIETRSARIAAMRDRLIDGILTGIPEVRLNGHMQNRLPGNVNVSVRYIEGEALLLRLDMRGIAGSSGSACTSGSLDPSHVLLAIGLPHEIAHGSLRLSLSDQTTDQEVDYVLEQLPAIVASLREMSPLFSQQKGDLAYV